MSAPASSPSQPQPSAQPAPLGNRPLTRAGRLAVDISHGIVLALSLALILYISYDTFENVPFLSSHTYMTFQLWVCLYFLFDFFLALALVPDKRGYVRRRWLFLLISIPYLNIYKMLPGLELSPTVLYFLRFVPLVRGCYSLSLVVGYVSANRSVSMLTQYAVILATMVYIGSLIFYYEEHGVNAAVTNYWDALYWACMNVNTVGCSFAPVTVAGRIISTILPLGGMLLLPLFTAALVNKVSVTAREQRQDRI